MNHLRAAAGMATTFDVRKWLRTRARSDTAVSVSQPQQISCWSKTSAQEGGQYLYGDSSGLAPYTQPQLPADLNEGYPQQYVRKDEGASPVPVERVMQGAAAGGTNWGTVHICTFRNNLNKICLTPLNPRDAWVVDCTLVGCTLFLDIQPAPGADKTFANQDLYTFYGYKFEAVCTGNSPVVDSTSEFAIVVSYRLGQHQVIMAAEVDCHDPAKQGAAAHGHKYYLELKTYKAPGHQRAQENIYRHKHPRWWVQSFLAGVPALLLGSRDDRGMLTKVHTVPVSRLQELSARAGQAWEGDQLLRFGEEVLSWMTACAKAQPGMHLRCSYDGNAQVITCTAVAGGQLPARVQAALAHMTTTAMAGDTSTDGRQDVQCQPDVAGQAAMEREQAITLHDTRRPSENRAGAAAALRTSMQTLPSETEQRTDTIS